MQRKTVVTPSIFWQQGFVVAVMGNGRRCPYEDPDTVTEWWAGWRAGGKFAISHSELVRK